MKRKSDEMNGVTEYAIPPLPNFSVPPPLTPPVNFLTGTVNQRVPWVPRGPTPLPVGLGQNPVMRPGGFQPCWQGPPPWRGPRPNNRGYYGGGPRQQRGRGGPRYGGYQDYYGQQCYQGGGYQQQQHQQQQQQQHQQQMQQQNQLQQNNMEDTEANASDGCGGGQDGDQPKTKDKKRKSMSQSYPTRPWDKGDAEKALREENSHMKGLRNQSLIIRFPDPDLSKDIVKSFHTAIENVHFQVPSGPRYCFVQLSDKVNAEKTIKELEHIKFGAGKLTVEKKFHKDEEDISPEAIDPYTLYIGNLPTNINVLSVKEKFPTAARIDIGFAQKMKFTRYAFVRYNSVEEAIDAYRSTHNLVLDSRSIIVRFRRQRGHVGMPGEAKPPKPVKDVELTKTKPKKEKVKTEGENNEDDDEEEDEDDDEDDDEEDDDDEDDDDDDDPDENPDNDDDDEDDEEEPDADDDDPDDDDDDDDDDEDLSGSLIQQLDSQISELDGVQFNL